MTVAALISQFALLGILAVGLALYDEPYSSYSVDRALHGRKPWAVLIFLALFGLGPLILSSDVTSMGMTVFGDRNVAVFRASSAIGFALVADIIVVTILVGLSGGSRESPFTAALVMVPALAIFLWQSYVAISAYVVAVSLAVMMTSISDGYQARDSKSYWSFNFVNIATLTLATYISYITRKP